MLNPVDLNSLLQAREPQQQQRPLSLDAGRESMNGLGPQRMPAIGAGGETFTEMLTKAVGDVDTTMKESEQKIQDFVSGKSENVHDVMISMQRAQISFQMMVEIRNKAIETYHEISRMQI
ncbi:MAG: flagellar hook-basal body complex protein FliE [Balneolaceae bacterium]|nr:MAG: flagellar hook-basal body complex protein FliE [Balneolaceae bacterium]